MKRWELRCYPDAMGESFCGVVVPLSGLDALDEEDADRVFVERLRDAYIDIAVEVDAHLRRKTS